MTSQDVTSADVQAAPWPSKNTIILDYMRDGFQLTSREEEEEEPTAQVWSTQSNSPVVPTLCEDSTTQIWRTSQG